MSLTRIFVKLEYSVCYLQSSSSNVTKPTKPAAKIAQPAAVPTVPASDLCETEMRESLLKKQKELLELQQKKLEIELLQTKARLQQQQVTETMKSYFMTWLKPSCSLFSRYSSSAQFRRHHSMWLMDYQFLKKLQRFSQRVRWMRLICQFHHRLMPSPFQNRWNWP